MQRLLDHVLLLLLLHFALAQQTTAKDVANCTCGFYDETAGLVFTDTSIVYFNETSSIPDELVVESFEHKYDLGWNALYRQGASTENIEVANDTTARNLTSLALHCNPSTNEGLVVGSSVRTARQDIFFGSFRASMRAPRSWFHGSALSMVVDHNATERWNVDVMNTANSSQAWISTLAKGQFSDLWLGKNFTSLIAAGIDPWYYVEYRVDWTRDRIDYYIGGVLQKSFTTELNGTLPSTPVPIRWQHWSLGNDYHTQGPPAQRSEANIGWTRIFFNSSLPTDKEREAFDSRCTPSAACRMDDNTLRGSSAHPPEALVPWKQFQPARTTPWVPLTIDIVFLAIFTLLAAKTLWRRFTMEKLYLFLGITKREIKPSSTCTNTISTNEPSINNYNTTEHKHLSTAGSTDGRLQSWDSSRLSSPPAYPGTRTPLPEYQSPSTSRQASRVNSMNDLTINNQLSPRNGVATSIEQRTSSLTHLSADHSLLTVAEFGPKLDDKSPHAVITEERKSEDGPIPPATESTKVPTQRLDYLAGFISFSAILVTLNHFSLTFWASVINPSVRPHYSSETWARRTIATFFLDPLWIGPFLMISTRFLVSNYLRNGKLGDLAKKAVARPFRLLTPVATIATLQYFLADAGALNWLQSLPSVTWSSWPYTTIVQNPGVFISELVQLAFLIPNAAPNITYNYCTGVLWTIPVQLQGAWQTILALIIVKECKTPWKRFAFYAFGAVNHWYGLSWGSYYYAGILLADLDITFKYKKWLHVRPFVYYPLLGLLIGVALGGFGIDVAEQWSGIQYAMVEYGWHPDTATGYPIAQSANSLYPGAPDYFIPRLNGLLSTVAMQAIVEISPRLQKVLSANVLQWVFPHVFTIYLIHGFIFWSVGSWGMITFFSYGLPYWLCVLLTAIVCYGTLFACLPLLTPPIELLGKKMTMAIWENASEEPVPRKPTTFPFGKGLLIKDIDTAPNSILEEYEEKSSRPSPIVDEKAKCAVVGKIEEV